MLNHARKRRLVPQAVMAFLLVASLSCAYYNMLYNAKKKYDDAMKQPRANDGEVTRGQKAAFDDVIARCQVMIGTYPKSRHVDDAMLLIARSLFAQDRFLEAAAQLDSLELKFPDTDLLNKVRYLKGHALHKGEAHAEAIDVLNDFFERWPKDDRVPSALRDLSASCMSLGREDDAVKHLDYLEKHYPKDPNTFDAQASVAEILSDKGSYDKSLRVYEALNSRRIPRDSRYDVWMGLAKVYHAVGEDDKALEVTGKVMALAALRPEERAPVMLLRAEALAGVDSTEAAIDVFADVAKKFARGKFGAEAHFRLGEIYEAADSLERAQEHFQAVAPAYSSSEYADESIRRSGSISKLLKLQASAGDDSPEARSLRTFSLAELKLVQFDKPAEALALYEQILDEFPDSEYAPKAAYAIAYIYKAKLPDAEKARAALDLLMTRYPDTPQARHAATTLADVSQVEDGS